MLKQYIQSSLTKQALKKAYTVPDLFETALRLKWFENLNSLQAVISSRQREPNKAAFTVRSGKIVYLNQRQFEVLTTLTEWFMKS